MHKYHEALELICSLAAETGTEKVPLSGSVNRILGADVFQDIAMPPFNKSAMDGYACRRQDLGNELEIIETVYAGKQPEKKIRENQCYKIMTGAVVPDAADFVFPIEEADLPAADRVVCRNPNIGNNICYRGEDLSEGDKILDRSVLITPRHLPVLAGAGVVQPEVYCLPKVSVMATGTELVEPDKQPEWYQIRNSNSSQLLGQLNQLGIRASYKGILPDDPEVIGSAISDTFVNGEVLIFTGGVSVGEYDLLPELLGNAGFTIHISSTAIKPGKPMVFASKNNRYCFGLSGNPVSSFIQFELYVKPFLYRMMGHHYQAPTFRFPAGSDFKRKNAERINFIPANLNENMEIVPVEFHGSAHIHAVSRASYLIEVPQNIYSFQKGDFINVRSI